MSALLWMPKYYDAWMSGTDYMSWEEKGLYDHLLLLNFKTERPLPDDDETLAKWCRMKVAQFLKLVKPILMSKFQRVADGWMNARVEIEIQKAREQVRRCSKGGKESSRVKSLKKHGVGVKPLDLELQLNVNKLPVPSPLPSPSEQPRRKKVRKDSDPPAVDRLQVGEAAAEPEQAISTPEPLQEASEPVQTVEGVADWEKPKTALAVVRSPMVRASAAPAATSATWNAYAEAYERRYGTPPIRNAMVNGQIANLLRRVPMEEAPAIADYYLSLSKRYYVESQHPVGALLKDCESVRTQWATGRTMTSTKAQQTDRRRAAFEATFDAIEIIERRHEGARV